MMSSQDHKRVDEFAQRLGMKGESFTNFDLLTRDDQRELVRIAQRLGAAQGVAPSPVLVQARAERLRAVEHAQALLLRCELLERAGDLLANTSTDAEARAAWTEAKA